MYGCGLTKHGQLPFLKFSKSGGADSSSSSEDEGEDAELAAARGDGTSTRNEITIPTRLRLPFVQVEAPPCTPCLVNTHPQQAGMCSLRSEPSIVHMEQKLPYLPSKHVIACGRREEGGCLW